MAYNPVDLEVFWKRGGLKTTGDDDDGDDFAVLESPLHVLRRLKYIVLSHKSALAFPTES